MTLLIIEGGLRIARSRLMFELVDDPGETEQFEALADGLGDVGESPTEQAEFAALADGLGDDGE